MARLSNAAKAAAEKEAIVNEALDDLVFVYGEATEQDEYTIRAMVLAGADASLIKRAIAVAAVNQRVGPEDKSRYAFGVVRNTLQPVEYEED